MLLSDADIALAHTLADLAGQAIRPFFRARYAIETKSDRSPVTAADRAGAVALQVRQIGSFGESPAAEIALPAL